MARLQKLYREKIAAELKEKFGYTCYGSAPSDQDHPEHGCERSRGRQEGDGQRRG
jgi:hypothetical protein